MNSYFIQNRNQSFASVTVSSTIAMQKMLNSISSIFACITLAFFATLLPVKQAHADNIYQALETVCNQAQGLCGPGYQGIVDGCFKGGDELKCAVAIIDLSSGGQVSKSQSQIDAIISCIKDGIPIKDACNTQLQLAGVSGSKINEAYGLINRCAGINDVDDAIVCADALLDSSIAEDADLSVPSWVNSMFDVYIDLRDKDYWGLVYHVGATIACAVANYFTGNDICAFLEDLVEIAGDVVDGAKAVGGALNNVGEKIFTNQHQHIPVTQYFSENWLPDVDTYARNIVVQKNNTYWSSNVGAKYTNCVNYFSSHTMSNGKAGRACNDMRDGTNTSDNSFIDKGFSQLASRRGAIMLLPTLLSQAAIARIKQLRAQGLFKAEPLPAKLVESDPWHQASEVPNIDAQIYIIYGLNSQGAIFDSNFNHYAQTATQAWREKSVGYVAYLHISTAKVPVATLNFETSETIAKISLSSGEAAINFINEVNDYIKKVQATRVKTAEQSLVISNSIQSSIEKPLNDMLALCAPKSLLSCEQEVRSKFAICDAKAKAYYDANANLIGDFDSSKGKAAYKQWSEIRRLCEDDIKTFVQNLPNGSKNKRINPVDTSGAYIDASDLQKNVPHVNVATNREPPSSNNAGAATKLVNNTASLQDSLKRNSLGSTIKNNVSTINNQSVLSGLQNSEVNNSNNATYGQNNSSRASGLGLTAPVSSNSIDAAVLAQCKAFLGRKDELICTNTRAFNACKVQVDQNKIRVCHIVGSQVSYPALR